MYYLLLTLLVLDALLLATVVLLQAGKGGGLAAMGAAGAGSDSLFGSRQATTLLTKATWWTGAIFLILCFILSLMVGQSSQPSSILRDGIQAPATAPVLPGGQSPLGPGVEGANPAEPAVGTPAEGDAVVPAPGTPEQQ